MKYGLNLFSILNKIKTPEALLQTAGELKEMGYSFLQMSGVNHTPETVRRVVDEVGMPIVLTHMPMPRIIGETEALMEEHASFGCKYIGLGAIPAPEIADQDKCKAHIEALEAAAEKMEKNGFRFFYHHHHFELSRMGDETVLEYMLRTAPHIHFTLDTYWLQYGGVNVLEYLKKFEGRCECIHLKDFAVRPKLGEDGAFQGFEPTIVPVGDGNINFPAVVEAAKAAGAEYFLVEQDTAFKLPDTMEQVRRSANYLNKTFAD